MSERSEMSEMSKRKDIVRTIIIHAFIISITYFKINQQAVYAQYKYVLYNTKSLFRNIFQITLYDWFVIQHSNIKPTCLSMSMMRVFFTSVHKLSSTPPLNFGGQSAFLEMK